MKSKNDTYFSGAFTKLRQGTMNFVMSYVYFSRTYLVKVVASGGFEYAKSEKSKLMFLFRQTNDEMMMSLFQKSAP